MANTIYGLRSLKDLHSFYMAEYRYMDPYFFGILLKRMMSIATMEPGQKLVKLNGKERELMVDGKVKSTFGKGGSYRGEGVELKSLIVTKRLTKSILLWM